MDPTRVSFIAGAASKPGTVYVSFWTEGSAASFRVSLSAADARHLAAELVKEADALPRVACAADLGVT